MQHSLRHLFSSDAVDQLYLATRALGRNALRGKAGEALGVGGWQAFSGQRRLEVLKSHPRFHRGVEVVFVDIENFIDPCRAEDDVPFIGIEPSRGVTGIPFSLANCRIPDI